MGGLWGTAVLVAAAAAENSVAQEDASGPRNATWAKSCGNYPCPDGRSPLPNADAVECTRLDDSYPGFPPQCDHADTHANLNDCCPETIAVDADELRRTGDYYHVVLVNLIGWIPLALTIYLTWWARREMLKKEEKECLNIQSSKALFHDMENKALKHSHRAATFMGKDRRDALNVSAAQSLAMASARELIVTIEKRVGAELGFGVESLEDDEDDDSTAGAAKRERAIVVVDIENDSPADYAGMTKGMVIKKVGNLVMTMKNIKKAVQDAPNIFTMTVLLPEHEREREIRSERAQSARAIRVKRQILKRFRVTKDEEGLVGMRIDGLEVQELKPDGPAKKAGILEGMLVYAVDDEIADRNNVGYLLASVGDSFTIDMCEFIEQDGTSMLLSKGSYTKDKNPMTREWHRVAAAPQSIRNLDLRQKLRVDGEYYEEGMEGEGESTGFHGVGPEESAYRTGSGWGQQFAQRGSIGAYAASEGDSTVAPTQSSLRRPSGAPGASRRSVRMASTVIDPSDVDLHDQ